MDKQKVQSGQSSEGPAGTPVCSSGVGQRGEEPRGETMWLPPALLLLSLPGEWGWGLGDLVLQGQGRGQRASVPGTTRGVTGKGQVALLIQSAKARWGPTLCQVCIRPRGHEREREMGLVVTKRTSDGSGGDTYRPTTTAGTEVTTRHRGTCTQKTEHV